MSTVTTRAKLANIEIVFDYDSDPDLSYLEQDYADVKSPVKRNQYRKQDRERLAAYNAGDWHMVYLYAKATVAVDTGADPAHNVNWITRQTLQSGGIGGVESDAGRDYLTELAREQLAELKGIVEAMGIAWDVDMAEAALV